MYEGRDHIKLTLLGDVLCKYQMIVSFASRGEDRRAVFDFDPMLEEVRPLLDGSDYVIANLETPVSEDNTNLCRARYNFNAPYEFAEALKKAGIDFVSTANNHCLDRGIGGIGSTIRSLDKVGLKHTGTYDAQPVTPCITAVGGLRLGILSYTYGTNEPIETVIPDSGERWRIDSFSTLRISENQLALSHCGKAMSDRIAELKSKNPDLIIMCLHTGGQYNDGATPDTRLLCGQVLSQGVNIVAGNHEHVIHRGDFSRISENRLIAYSLGNFTGVSGVYSVPFDKRAEYSVAWHVYVDRTSKQITGTSFSILKCIQPDPRSYRIKVVPVYQLQDRLDGVKLAELKDDVKQAVWDFAGMQRDEILPEYVIRDI